MYSSLKLVYYVLLDNLIFTFNIFKIAECYFQRGKYLASIGMYDRSEIDLILASKQAFTDDTKKYQIYHKLAQCQLKLKKRQYSMNSLQCARKYLSTADLEHPNKVRFDKILKDSIKKISQRVAESKAMAIVDNDLPTTDTTSLTNGFIPSIGKSRKLFLELLQKLHIISTLENSTIKKHIGH